MYVLDPDQEEQIRDHWHTIGARETCPVCDAGRFTLGLSDWVGIITRTCQCCGHILFFDPAIFGLRLHLTRWPGVPVHD